MAEEVHIIGGGLAGSEAAWQLANRGIKVRLSEMRGSGVKTPVHQTDQLAELVCSNSFRSDDHTKNAVGLLHHEMRQLGSLIMLAGEKARVPAGSAMAVDRDLFATEVTQLLTRHQNVNLVREEITILPKTSRAIVATGPLTSSSLAESIVMETGQERLAFFDAIAPIVYRDSIDMTKCWIQSRWDKSTEGSNEGGDYINCPLTKEQYLAFHKGLLQGEKTEFRDWEIDTPYFEGCMPIEVMAERGVETLRYGPMKGVGLDNPYDTSPDFPQGRWPYAVVQLRQDNKIGSLWNIVGFQTKLKYNAQVELFRTIPGLENAQFARLGGLHRNTFIKSPTLLDTQLRFRKAPNIRFAGQITGCEGYIESAAVGLAAGLMTASEHLGNNWLEFPKTTAIGSLIEHITNGADKETFQPMNINFGLFPTLSGLPKKQRKEAYTRRAKESLKIWQSSMTDSSR